MTIGGVSDWQPTNATSIDRDIEKCKKRLTE